MLSYRGVAAVVLVAAVLAVSGCATTTTSKARMPLDVTPTEPADGEVIVVDQFYVVVDASFSQGMFPCEKALVQSLVRAIPNGFYEAGLLSFGGYSSADWQQCELAPLDRGHLEARAAGLRHLGGLTPLDRALLAAGRDLGARTGRAAVVVFSDGEADRAATLAACQALADEYAGDLCIYTVFVGDADTKAGGLGRVLLADMASTTGCGHAWDQAEIASAAGMEQMVRRIFFGRLPAVAAPAAPRDIGNVYFDFDSARVKPEYDALLDDAAALALQGTGVTVRVAYPEILEGSKEPGVARPDFDTIQNEAIRFLNEGDITTADADAWIKADGHTDSVGSMTYNHGLARRRAEAVAEQLVQRGVPRERIEIGVFGEQAPAVPNSSASNRALNRRVELRVLR